MNTIGFIGGGNMGTAIGKSIISNHLYEPSKVWVSGPHVESLKHWSSMGVNVTAQNRELVDHCDIIFLCIKPNMLTTATLEAANAVNKKNKLFISVLAGTKITALKQALSPFPEHRIVRVMPNTPSMIGAGATVYAVDTDTVKPSDVTVVEKILHCLGLYSCIPESMINAYGALSGSGPAFIYLIIEALSDGGVKQGIPREKATQYAAQTVLGAAKMVLESGKHPGQLKDEVCSPGGTTICGIHQLEKDGVRASMMSAIEAAFTKTLTLEKRDI